MPFSFPSSPSVGQQSTQNGRTYSWTGAAWELVAASGGSGSIVTAASVSGFPATGSASNLYITTEDQRIWRWDSTASIYVETGPIGGGFAFASVPASATATGTAGQVAADGSHWYYCSAPNTWVRTALGSWEKDPHFSNVSLLLHMDGANNSTTFTDSSPSPKAPTVYAATISTTQSRFGGACGSFANASAARLEYANNAAFGFGTSDFTIEMWTRANNATVGSVISIGLYTNGITWRLSRSGDGIYINGTSYNWNPSDNLVPYGQWAHIALVREGTTARIFIDGSSVWSQNIGTVDLGSSRPCYVAAGGHYLDGGPEEGYDGFIDELRVTKGICRYTGGTSFTPRTAAFPNE
jgi:hypothetical protein